ncbi:putative uncharacterized protein [Pseudarthrobacter siccitolerans]|uniref:Uncharacterized protein n=1 Tax=Pseudarthrobacter siccitolerans TaxID=861266 RepID=A0A024H2Y3_9MICC|nr:hypothetical protein [Pseudarthrobacter siccitolerans]CCQ46081.1 putative uncharacterized protein [Pseudarthrobacter siccitolerans]
MTAPSRGPFTAFLLRTGLLTAALAIIAGIFGMHIMTGAHHMSAGHSMPATAAQSTVHLDSLPSSHSHPPGTSADRAAITPAATGSSSSSCAPAGSCPEMSAGDGACVLAQGNTSLTAPVPGTAPYVLPDFGAAAAVSTNYSFSPASPTPGDLCISRT